MPTCLSGESVRDSSHRNYLLIDSYLDTADRQPFQVFEDSDSAQAFQCPERFLQALWNEQRFSPDLVAVDGRRVEVISPGTWNVAAGPDFRNALLKLDGIPVSGDVEIHRREADWFQHGHHEDPGYGNVVLHVVWSSCSTPRPELPPCLVISGVLDASWQELTEELSGEMYPYARQVPPGACALRWALSNDDRVVRVLGAAGRTRFKRKAAAIRRDVIRLGAEQALHEHIFEALGYRANRAPFRALAHQVPLETLRQLPDRASREGLLFGCAALLPDPSVAGLPLERRRHVRRLWDSWWSQGVSPLDLSWRRSGSRPFNSPERRLAAAVALLERHARCWPDGWLLPLVQEAESGRELIAALDEALDVRDPWEKWRDFRTALGRPARLLGRARRGDIIVNVLLPYISARIDNGPGDGLCRQKVEEAYMSVPASQSNRLLTEAVHRFLVPPSRAGVLLRRACHQQGLLEIYRNLCLLLHGDCKNCPFVGNRRFADRQ